VVSGIDERLLDTLDDLTGEDVAEQPGTGWVEQQTDGLGLLHAQAARRGVGNIAEPLTSVEDAFARYRVDRALPLRAYDIVEIEQPASRAMSVIEAMARVRPYALARQESIR